jgi:hypothetical protein
MQFGDLEESRRESLLLVLEGVLVQVTESNVKHRFRGSDTTWHFQWHEVPLKRLIATKDRYPAYEIDIVTFLGDTVKDTAAEYLTSIEVPYDEITAWDLDDFAMSLRFRPGVRAVYDSDPERLNHYGQLGHAVMRGADW